MATVCARQDDTLEVAEYQGRKYEWRDGRWVDPHRGTLAPVAISRELDAVRGRSIARYQLGKHVSDPARRQDLFEEFHYELGMSLGELTRNGFFEEAFEKDPVAALVARYDSTTVPAGRCFLNCPHLRDRFFLSIEPHGFPLSVELVGEGPFERADFRSFCQWQGVRVGDHGGPCHALVIGRDQWTKSVVDRIVEAAEGGVLRVYSQEMFTAVLAGQPDPFETWPVRDRLKDLYAFRAGHPALEYVSQGWAGWVTGYASSWAWDLGAWVGRSDSVTESPLRMMGYRVGVAGLDVSSRRAILTTAFECPIPYVGDAAYMEQWGQPGSGNRLKRIAEQLVANIATHGKLANHEAAVEEWLEDLRWLEMTFYSGAYSFAWPQASR